MIFDANGYAKPLLNLFDPADFAAVAPVKSSAGHDTSSATKHSSTATKTDTHGDPSGGTQCWIEVATPVTPAN